MSSWWSRSSGYSGDAGYAAGNSAGYPPAQGGGGGYSGGNFNNRPLPTFTAAPISHVQATSVNKGWFDLSGYKAADNTAALQALALLSFLFFLDMLQTQLSNTGTQTIIVSGTTGTGTLTGGTGGTAVGKRKKREINRVDVWGREYEKHDIGEYQKIIENEFWIQDDDAMENNLNPLKTDDNDIDTQWNNLHKAITKLFTGSNNNNYNLIKCKTNLACTIHKHSSQRNHSSLITMLRSSGINDADTECTDDISDLQGQCIEITKSLENLLNHEDIEEVTIE